MAEPYIPGESEPRATVEEIAEALVQRKGNISAVARELGYSRRGTLKDRIDRTPELSAIMDDIREGVLDRSEENVFTAADNGDVKTSLWILERLGKKRGYAQRQEITDGDGKPVAPATFVVKMYAEDEAEMEREGDVSNQGD